jgi:hypothetical protein
LLVASLTFSIGVAAVSLWAISRLSSQKDIPPAVILEKRVESAPAKAQTATDDRNLSLYYFGGRQGCGIVRRSQLSRCEASIRRARDFIWEHWQEKKRGYVIVKWGGDDAQSDAHIFVEPDESGSWHVVWKWERIFALSMPNDISGRIDNVPGIRAVERRRAMDRYKMGPWYLSFLGKDGEEILDL